MSFYSFADWIKAKSTEFSNTTVDYWRRAARGQEGKLPYVAANTAQDAAVSTLAGVAGTAGALTFTPGNAATELANKARSEWRSEVGKRAYQEGGLRELPYQLGEFAAPATVGGLAAKAVSKIPAVARAADPLVNKLIPLAAGATAEGVIQGGQMYAEGSPAVQALVNVPYAFGVNFLGGAYIPKFVGNVSRNLGRLLSPSEQAALRTMRSTRIPYGKQLGEGVLRSSRGYSPVTPAQRFIIGEMTEQAAPDLTW